MTNGTDIKRRRFVEMVGAAGTVGFLAGCLGDGGGDETPEATPTATPEPTPTPEETPEPTPEDTPEPTPEETPEPTPEETPTPEEQTLEDIVEGVNASIDQINGAEEASISSLNEALQNVEAIGTLDPVEAETPEEAAQEAQRLREEFDELETTILRRVAEEINAQAGMQIYEVDSIDDREDARDEAQVAEALNPDAAEAMWDAIDLVEYIDGEIQSGADALEGFESE